MTEQNATTEVVVETPKERKLRIKFPTRSTVKKVAALAGAATLGGVVTARALKRNCGPCSVGNDTEAGTADQSTD